jgi:crotonobetainyl-CoA:carnitine CoA-transferase CaiB-like acyl-CoA transferase
MHQDTAETSDATRPDALTGVVGPLTGTVVVDLTRALAGPHAG